MINALWGMLVLVYRSIVGRLWSKITSNSISKMYYTSNRYESTLELNPDVLVHFYSHQIKVITYYQPWWMMKRIGYLYEVKMEVFRGGKKENVRSVTLPHMCPRVLRKSEFPHMYAIQVCIDLWHSLN